MKSSDREIGSTKNSPNGSMGNTIKIKKSPEGGKKGKENSPKKKYPKRNPASAQADPSSAGQSAEPADQKTEKKESSKAVPAAVAGAGAVAAAGTGTKSVKETGDPGSSGQAGGQDASCSSSEKKKKRKRWKALLCILLILLLILGGIYFVPTKVYGRAHDGLHRGTSGVLTGITSMKDQGKKNSSEDSDDSGEKEAEENYEFHPHAVDSTDPARRIKSTQVQVDGKTLADISEYQPKEKITFETGDQYTEVDGIITFRGNNFRDSASYGTASITKKKFGDAWTKDTTALVAPDGEFWSGNGWTGQPLIVTWSKDTRQHMYMESWAQEQDHLTEVIYASLDGHIYFLELETGKETRPAMELGYTFKGAGALDPRGYPILYVGSGYDSKLGRSHAFIINLLDCKVMHEFGKQDPFSLRGNLSFFDSSPLVDAETDQLIYPGENGILYIMKLNTKYQEKKGSLTIDPEEPVRWHYSGSRSWYLGMEDSALIWKGHIFFTTNDGYLFCLNLNTLETVWVQDVLDDTNCTPVLELEDGHPYIYTSTSFHLGWRSSTTAEIPVWKIDAETGEIVWSTSYECRSVKGNSGGVQGTLAIGKHDLKDLIFVPVAKTPTVSSGKIVALNKKTGEEEWVLEDNAYTWSSPVTVYTKKGKGYVITCDSIGDMYLLDGKTGEVLDNMNLGSNVEASPAVYKDTLVVGTRGQKIYGVKLQ